MKMKKRDWWLVTVITAFIAAVIICIATAGCGKVLEGTGNLFEAVGQGATGIGEHLVETGKGQ